MSALWLAFKELLNRKWRFLINIGLISMAITLSTSMELISLSREHAVESRINLAGPALKIIPGTLSESDLKRFDTGSELLPLQISGILQQKFIKWINAVESRLYFKRKYAGQNLPVIGIDALNSITPFNAIKTMKSNEAVLGPEIAKELNKKTGDSIRIGDKTFLIKSVNEESGSVEDTAVFIRLEAAQLITGINSAVNELRIFPHSGVPTVELEKILSTRLLNRIKGLKIIRTARTETAEKGLESSLQLYRSILYGFTVIAVTLSIIISSHLNATERRIELATLFAIGSSSSLVLFTLILRAFILGLMGSILGCFLGAVITLFHDISSVHPVIISWELFLYTIGGTTIICLLATMPVSVLSAYRNHVLVLQEE